jgi:hypothetical protein
VAFAPKRGCIVPAATEDLPEICRASSKVPWQTKNESFCFVSVCGWSRKTQLRSGTQKLLAGYYFARI